MLCHLFCGGNRCDNNYTAIISSTSTVKFCMGGRFCSLCQTHSDCESTSGEIMSFRPRNRVKTKKKGSSPQFGTIFGRNLCDLFVLTDVFSFDHPALKSRWGTLNLDRRTPTIDGKGGASPRVSHTI